MECGCVYRCRFERQVVGGGDTLEEAHTSATRAAGDPITRDLDAPACPICGLVPARMVGNIRCDPPARPLLAGAIGAVVLIGLGGAKGAPHDNSAILLAIWALIVLVWHWAVNPRDPNRDREANLAASAALIARGRLVVLQKSTQNFVTPITLPTPSGLVWLLGVLAVPLPILPQLMGTLTGWEPAWVWWVAVLASGVLSFAMGATLSLLANSLAKQSPAPVVARLDAVDGGEIVLHPDVPWK